MAEMMWKKRKTFFPYFLKVLMYPYVEISHKNRIMCVHSLHEYGRTLRSERKTHSGCFWLKSKYLDFRVLAGYLTSYWKLISYRENCSHNSKPQQARHVFPFCVQCYAEVIGVVMI